MQHFAGNGCSRLVELLVVVIWMGTWAKEPAQAKEQSLTSIYILTPKVVSVEEHELDPVALVQRHQADQQQEDGAQTSGQLHRVHQLCWSGHNVREREGKG